MAGQGQTSEYFRSLLLSAFFRREYLLDQVFVGVSVAAVPPGINAVDLSEPEDPAYMRVPYAVGVDFWSLSGYITVLNSQQVVFAPPTDDWGQLSNWLIATEATGGVVLASGLMEPAFQLRAGMAALSIDPYGIGVRLL